MPIVPIGNAGEIGVNKDLSNYLLPNNAWSDALNMRFLDGMAMQTLGYGEIYASPPVIPYNVMPIYVGADRYWLYAGLTKIYAVSDASGTVVHTDLTRQTAGVDVDYSGQPNAWTSTSLSGIPVFNNGVDPPQRWSLDIAARCEDLDNWPSGYTCRSLRAYKNQLVALNVTKSGTNYPYLVLWSTEADPGAVPSTWDVTDPTNDAGQVDLSEGGDPILDGMQLGGTFIVYKERSIWRMDYVGGSFVEQFTKVLGTSGAMNRNCIVEIDGYHVVLTNDDVLVHDGQTATSVLDKESRRNLFQSIDPQAIGLCFVFKNPFVNEIAVCYPEAGSTVCNKAMLWNYVDKTVSFRTIPSLNHATFGPIETNASDPWSADSSPWASDVSEWNGPDYTPDASRVMMASMDQQLYLLDSSTTFNGALPTAYLERRGLAFTEPEKRKLVRGIRPRIFGNAGEQITIQVAGMDDPYVDPVYTATMTHTIGETVANDCFVDGRYIAIRFEGLNAFQWRLDSYDVDVVEAGNW